ncbi:hypothetical protein [Fuchsiella alkaliacetigena]|uniref:hypothetical protein n=1 Tax=Fuchsiella alkaliacetigena TaxID=957042 RepID=UPI00200AA5E0|nr:hypothetical protein [Fuchsiella alkaliacetigena]MCK8823606.1 hypothetical protein [Fuchsiella alkaliacetigena]
MSSSEISSQRLTEGDVVVKTSESKELYFQVVKISGDFIKIRALSLPVYTYVAPEELVKVTSSDWKK